MADLRRQIRCGTASVDQLERQHRIEGQLQSDDSDDAFGADHGPLDELSMDQRVGEGKQRMLGCRNGFQAGAGQRLRRHIGGDQQPLVEKVVDHFAGIGDHLLGGLTGEYLSKTCQLGGVLPLRFGELRGHPLGENPYPLAQGPLERFLFHRHMPLLTASRWGHHAGAYRSAEGRADGEWVAQGHIDDGFEVGAARSCIEQRLPHPDKAFTVESVELDIEHHVGLQQAACRRVHRA